MKIVAFIPIKLNSERLVNKNILSFDNGKPLAHYIQETLLKVNNIDEIYIYCSDEKIKNYMLQDIKFISRDPNLDLSETPFNEVLTSFAKVVPADYYILTHTTAPFIKHESIQLGVNKIINEGYDSALGVKRIQEFIWRYNQPINYSLNDIPRTQDLPLIYAETCGLYIYSRDLILSKNQRVGNNPYFIELSKVESIDINDEEDFIIANAISNRVKL